MFHHLKETPQHSGASQGLIGEASAPVAHERLQAIGLDAEAGLNSHQLCSFGLRRADSTLLVQEDAEEAATPGAGS